MIFQMVFSISHDRDSSRKAYIVLDLASNVKGILARILSLKHTWQ